MAEVFRARHRYLGCIRAVKVLHPAVSAEPDTTGRLLMEARTLAGLRHPAIVEVYDCDVLADATAFIAMECLSGESLRAWLDRMGSLSHDPRLAAAILAAIGEGLAFAHQRGVIHRDLKPENIFVVPEAGDGSRFSLKILDFGLAKVRGQESLTTTRTGCVTGTPLYMAPERWRPGEPVDQRSDIYALGCLLFELLCGRPPFSEETEMGIMRAHVVEAPPDLRVIAPDVPGALPALLARMLAKAPADRPGSVEQVLTELEPVLGCNRSAWPQLLRVPRNSILEARATDYYAQSDTSLRAWFDLPVWLRSHGVALLSRLAAGLRGPGRRWVLAALLISAAMAWLLVAHRPPAQHRHSAASPPLLAAPAPRPAPPSASGSARDRGPQLNSYTVRVISHPPGAQVWLDGQPATRGRTPLDIRVRSDRPAHIRLTAPGYKISTLTISRRQAGSPVHVRLARAGRVRAPPTLRRGTTTARRKPSSRYHPVED